MNYSDILSLNDCFYPVCDLQEEHADYWKSFIPNEVFEDRLLDAVLKANSSNPQDKKAVWVRGTFGSGKSHASAVVKHLLCDDVSSIEDWVNTALTPANKARLKRYREEKGAYFPIILKGVNLVRDVQTFVWYIQSVVSRQIRECLEEFALKNDFDLYRTKLEDPTINWNAIIDSSLTLKSYVSDREDLAKCLKNQDFDVLVALVKTLSDKNIHFSISETDLPQWLKSATEVVKKHNYAGIILIWDEFTSVLDRATSLIINSLQNVAELSASTDFILYLISHRTESYRGKGQDEFSKLDDRFHIIYYNMESSTSYHILSKALQVKNAAEWNAYFNSVISHAPELKDLVASLTHDEHRSAIAGEELLKLLPLHPYTTFLCAMISRRIGSSSRSIFKFLYDKDNGFYRFLLNTTNTRSMCTADILWDFFEEELGKGNSSIFACYNKNVGKLKAMGGDYVSVFKTILLLNILSQKLLTQGTGFTTPSRENIEKVYIGAISSEKVQEILDYIHDQEIIYQDPYQNFKVETSQLPQQEIEAEFEELKKAGIGLSSLLSRVHQHDIEKNFSSLKRPVEVSFLDGNIDSPACMSAVKQSFEKVISGPTVYINCFFCLSEECIDSLKDHLSSLFSARKIQKNLVIIIISSTLSEKEAQLLYRYQATANIAKKHNRADLADVSTKNVDKITDDWFVRVKQGHCTIYTGADNGGIEATYVDAERRISFALEKKLYTCSFSEYAFTEVAWKLATPRKTVETVLRATSGKELLDSFSSGADSTIKHLFQDTKGNVIISSDSLQFRDDCPATHPLKLITDKVRVLLKKAVKRTDFNIAEIFNDLTEPPFGLFRCKVYEAALAFALANCLSGQELYYSSTGKSAQDTAALRDIILFIFEFWEKNGRIPPADKLKLTLRFGSMEENELKSCLIDIFNLQDLESTTAVLDFIKYQFTMGKGTPLWVLISEDEESSLASAMKVLFDFLTEPKYTKDSISACLAKIQPYKTDIAQIVNKSPQDYRNCFHQWLMSLHPGYITDENVAELYDFLKTRLPKEPSAWTKEHVNNQISSWLISRTGSKERTDVSEDETGSSSGHATSEFSEEEVDSVCSQLFDTHACSNTQLVSILREIFIEFPATMRIAKKFINNNV